MACFVAPGDRATARLAVATRQAVAGYCPSTNLHTFATVVALKAGKPLLDAVIGIAKQATASHRKAF